MRDYYQAYYRNYNFWYAQYQDVRNPNDLTKWLSDLGDKENPNNRPYPNATVALSWPNITVPLLVMPANSTVKDGGMYWNQAQKYKDRATSAHLVVLPGEHDVVYENPTALANNLLTLFTF